MIISSSAMQKQRLIREAYRCLNEMHKLLDTVESRRSGGSKKAA